MQLTNKEIDLLIEKYRAQIDTCAIRIQILVDEKQKLTTVPAEVRS